MKKILGILLALIAATGFSSQAQVARPKLVVGIVVDQMRWDYLYYYQDRFGDDGFKRLLNEGFSCQNTLIDYVPTVTACGHASVYTGTTPAVHGIAGNDYLLNGKSVNSVEDPFAKGVGTPNKTGQKSPRNMLTSTIGGELRAATKFRSKVFGVALKDRAAILPAGHTANAAYWFDAKVPGFITSDYYMSELPDWVKQFNKEHNKPEVKNPMYTPLGVPLTFDMATAVLKNERLGQDESTDMLCISVSSTDIVAHTKGTRSLPTDSCYMLLDQELAKFFNTLDDQVGKGNYLLFLTADHGGTNNYKYNSTHRLPSGGWTYWGKENADYNNVLKQKFGVDKLVTHVMEFSLYIDEDLIAKNHLNRDEVIAAIKEYFMQDPDVDRLVDVKNIDKEPLPAEIKERIIKGYKPGRSGEIFIMLKPGYYCGDEKGDGSNHGTWSMDDSHIPCVFMGWGVKHGETMQPNGMIDIAPTVCAMLHIQMPTGCLGKPIKALVP